ncbi:hypothetical protein Tco_0222356 [Tanacetum coccineum]
MSTLVFDPYEAIRQAYLVGTDTESEPFEDLGTESPESPHTVVSPVGHVEESESFKTSGAGSTSSDSTTPLSPDHPLTHDTPVSVLSLLRTARMAVRVQPAMSPSCSARIAEVAAMSDVAFRKRFRSPYESLPSPSPTLPVRKRSEGVEDEGPAAGDEDPGIRDEGFGLGEDEVVPEGQQRAALVVERAVGEPLGLGYGALRRQELAAKEDQRYSTFEVGVDTPECVTAVGTDNVEMEPDIENMTMNEYLKYKAAKERQLWDDVRYSRSPTNYNEEDVDSFHQNKKEDQEEDSDDGDNFDMWDIIVEEVERIRKIFNVPDEIDEIVQPLIPEPIHTTPPNDDYVATATKSILDEVLEEFRDKILNVTMVDDEADCNPTKHLEDHERLLAKEPQSNFMKIQVDAHEVDTWL